MPRLSSSRLIPHAHLHAPEGPDPLTPYYADREGGEALSIIASTINNPYNPQQLGATVKDVNNVDLVTVRANTSLSQSLFVSNKASDTLVYFPEEGGGVTVTADFNSMVTLRYQFYTGNCNNFSLLGAMPLLETLILATTSNTWLKEFALAPAGFPKLRSFVLGPFIPAVTKDSIYTGFNAAVPGQRTGAVIDTSLFNNAVTGSSLTARNELVAKGWTIIL